MKANQELCKHFFNSWPQGLGLLGAGNADCASPALRGIAGLLCQMAGAGLEASALGVQVEDELGKKFVAALRLCSEALVKMAHASLLGVAKESGAALVLPLLRCEASSAFAVLMGSKDLVPPLAE